ncbi:MAG TPA: FtsX-like permease family protein [Gammaproteobacteria bacterium]|jgi:putative ABC transport system permease protein|nr:FtsX-like permease family protein [Gammaproteobacteria bacterium]
MALHPILSATLRNKTGAILIALQIAITLAIVCNAVFIINERLDQIGRPTGMDVDNIFVIQSVGFSPKYNPADARRMDMDMLRAMPGVVDAAPISDIPLSGGGWGDALATKPGEGVSEQSGNIFTVDTHGLNAFGLKLVAGRNFRPDEILEEDSQSTDFPKVVIVTRAMADKLFPNGDALGKTVYEGAGGRHAATIIGIVERMQGAWVHWTGLERSVLAPIVYNQSFTRYIVRTEPGRRDAVMQAARQKLDTSNPGRFIQKVRSLADYRAKSYADDTAMATMLGVVTALILTITAFGIVGLASFSVNQRIKQIGTRRALGARRRDIVRYFMIENWMITSIGVVVGSALAVGVNFWLVNLFSIEPLTWYYIPVAILALWVLGLLAVMGPALRAARVPPAIATRTV